MHLAVCALPQFWVTKVLDIAQESSICFEYVWQVTWIWIHSERFYN